MAKKTTDKTELPTGMKSKTEIVKELLGKGITTPKDISAAAMTEYKEDISPGYASIIKSGLKKKSGKGKKVRAKRGVTATAKPKATADGSSDLSLENLALRFALKAGGVDQAIAAMERLR